MQTCKREYIRHPSEIPISYSLENVAASQNEYLKNISAGGLCFKSSVSVEKGSLIHIKIPLVRPRFEAKAAVVWCTRRGDYYDVGVKFLDVESEFRMRMIEQVCYIEHYKKEVFEKENRQLTCEQAALEWIEKYAADFTSK